MTEQDALIVRKIAIHNTTDNKVVLLHLMVDEEHKFCFALNRSGAEHLRAGIDKALTLQDAPGSSSTH